MQTPHAWPRKARGGAAHGSRLALLVVSAGILAMAEAPALGAEGAADGPPPARFSLADLGLRGSLTYKHFSHFQTTANDDRTFRNEGLLELEFNRRLASWSTLKLVGEALLDDANFARGLHYPVPDRKGRRSILGLKEGVLRLHGGEFEVTLGKQVYTWGTGDAFKPTDNINPHDYLDVLDNEKLGVYSAMARWSGATASVAAVVVPAFTPSRLPFAGDRWAPLPAAPLSGGVERPVFPAGQPANAQFAARLKATVEGWDLSVSYYEGFESIPVFRRSLAVASLVPLVVVPRFTPVFTRQRVPGVDFSTTVGKWEIHGEGAFKLADRDGWGDRFQGVLGFNYAWDDVGVSWLEQIVFVGEYAREIVLENRPESGVLRPSGALGLGDLLASNVFRNALVGRVLFKFTEDTQLKLTGVLDISGSPNHYSQAKLTHKLTGALNLETGVDLLTGPRDTIWGRWRANDRFFFLARYLF